MAIDLRDVNLDSDFLFGARLERRAQQLKHPLVPTWSEARKLAPELARWLMPDMAGGVVNTTWTNPTSSTLDLLTGQASSQAWTEALASNFNALGGATGRTVGGLRREWAKGADLASASAVAIGTDGNLLKITGTTTITSFTAVPQAGTQLMFWFAAALTLTNGSNINCPGGKNIVTTANTFIPAESDGTNLWFGLPVSPTTGFLAFQNTADLGKQFQRVASGTLTTSTTTGVFFFTTYALSWPATFLGTPTAQESGASTSAGGIWGAANTSVSTTACNGNCWGNSAAAAGTLECWGLG